MARFAKAATPEVRDHLASAGLSLALAFKELMDNAAPRPEPTPVEKIDLRGRRPRPWQRRSVSMSVAPRSLRASCHEDGKIVEEARRETPARDTAATRKVIAELVRELGESPRGRRRRYRRRRVCRR